MIQNIPSELRRLPQWVVTRLPDKVPLNPRTGQAADVLRPETWGTFEEALRSGHKLLGFVLTDDDPYTFIDLDMPVTPEQAERHSKILEAVDSYAELSQSGNGVHIIVRGHVPHGVRRDKVEVYSSGRYMICTGNVINHYPIVEAQELLDTLFEEMDSTARTTLTELPETCTDADIEDMARHAVNGSKFSLLWEGAWERGGYPSQSEADFALMAILGYYSKSNEQCRRLFRRSGLGQRRKAHRDKYLNYMLAKVRAKEPPPVDLSALVATASRLEPPPPPPMGGQKDGVKFPPGFVGDLAEHFMATAIRPVREVALTAALAVVAGVVGRSYNVSGTGLNQYIILLARTGSGKEGAANGIDALVAAAREQCPMADQFIGPAAFASGQALIRVLDERPCFVSVLGEFGITLQQICDHRAPEAKTMLKKVLLDLYAKSGWNKTLRPSVYSDSEKNTRLLQAPNVTILGESTPETFYGGLDQSHILEGLVPRFIVVEYNGPRPPRNPNAFAPPPPDIVGRFTDLLVTALATRQNNTCCPVAMDEESQGIMDTFDREADKMINSSGGEVARDLWNRAHLKALKLAALLAVGKDHQNPVITRDVTEWAVDFIRTEVTRMAAKFSSGDVGSGESKQENDIRRAITDYLRMSTAQRRTYKVPDSLLNQPFVPFHYLRRRLQLVASFKNDRRGHATALATMLEQMVRAETLSVLPAATAWERFNVRSALYAKGETW